LIATRAPDALDRYGAPTLDDMATWEASMTLEGQLATAGERKSEHREMHDVLV
jgi:hypothetical protein